MSCPSASYDISGDVSRIGGRPIFDNFRRRLNYDSTADPTPPVRFASPSPERLCPGRTSDRYENFRRATRNAGAIPNAGLYMSQDISAIEPTQRRGSSQGACPGAGRAMSARSPPRPSPLANSTYACPSARQQPRVRPAPRCAPPPMPREVSERPSRTMHSTTISKAPGGQQVITEELKEIFDRSGRKAANPERCPAAANAAYKRGNATYDVAPMGGSRQVSFDPPGGGRFGGSFSQHSISEEASEIFDSSEMFDSSEDGDGAYYDSSECPGNATYRAPNRTYTRPSNATYNVSNRPSPNATYNVSNRSCPNATYNVPKRPSRNATCNVPRRPSNSTYAAPQSPCSQRSPYSDYDSSGSPFDTQTITEEMTEIFDSSDEMDDSLLGKILRGEIGRNIQPMTPSEPSCNPDATYTKPQSRNATYSVTPVQSSQSVECPCSDGDSSVSFTPSRMSTPRKKRGGSVSKSIEGELTRREHEEREQLEQDLRRWQRARRRLVLDTSNLSASPT